MNLISGILPASNILVDANLTSKKRVFEQAGLLFENNQHISRSEVFESLFAREKLGSTGLGHGIAIPHGRIKNLKAATGALIRLRDGIPFEAADGQPIQLLFVLLVPARATDLHLQTLAALAEMFSDVSIRDQLLQASSAADIHHLVTLWTPNATAQHR